MPRTARQKGHEAPRRWRARTALRAQAGRAAGVSCREVFPGPSRNTTLRAEPPGTDSRRPGKDLPTGDAERAQMPASDAPALWRTRRAALRPAVTADPATAVHTAAAEVQAVDRRAVIRPARQRSHEEQLVQDQLAVIRFLALGQAPCLFEIERRDRPDLSDLNRRMKGSVRQAFRSRGARSWHATLPSCPSAGGIRRELEMNATPSRPTS